MSDLFKPDPAAPKASTTGTNVGKIFSKAFPSVVGATIPGVTDLTRLFTDLQISEGKRLAGAEVGTFANLISGLASGELGALRGPGGDVVREVSGLNKELDPEFFSGRADVGGLLPSVVENIRSLGSGSLTGGERAEIERSLARDRVAGGNLETPSNLETITNAVTFGSAARNRLQDAVAAATNFLPAATSFLQGSRQGVDTKSTAVANPTAIASAFTGSNIGTQGLDLAQGLLSAVGGLEANRQQINANRRGVGEKLLSVAPDVSY